MTREEICSRFVEEMMGVNSIKVERCQQDRLLFRGVYNEDTHNKLMEVFQEMRYRPAKKDWCYENDYHLVAFQHRYKRGKNTLLLFKNSVEVFVWFLK